MILYLLRFCIVIGTDEVWEKRRNDAGIGIYIVIGIVSDVRTRKMLLIGEREEMAKNAGIGIEFRGKKLFLPISRQ